GRPSLPLLDRIHDGNDLTQRAIQFIARLQAVQHEDAGTSTQKRFQPDRLGQFSDKEVTTTFGKKRLNNFFSSQSIGISFYNSSDQSRSYHRTQSLVVWTKGTKINLQKARRALRGTLFRLAPIRHASRHPLHWVASGNIFD